MFCKRPACCPRAPTLVFRFSLEAELNESLSRLEEKQRSYIRVSEMIEEKWKALEFIRKRQHFSTTTLLLEKIPLEKEQTIDRYDAEPNPAAKTAAEDYASSAS